MRAVRILLVLVALVCFGVALSYPIRYFLAQKSNDTELDKLAEMRSKVRQELTAPPEASEAPVTEQGADSGEAEALAPAEAAVGEAPAEQAAAEDTEAPQVVEEETAPTQEADKPERDEAPPVVEEEKASTQETAKPERAEAPPVVEEETAPTQEADKPERVEAPPVVEEEKASTQETAKPESAEALSEVEPVEQVKTSATEAQPVDETEATPTPTPAPTPTSTPTPEPTLEPNYWDLGKYMHMATPEPTPSPEPTPTPVPTPVPTPTPDRSIRKGPLPYPLKEKVEFNKQAMLPELKDIYELNNDLVGWVTIEDTVIDYPVVHNEDNDYYLSHDFNGEENINGQIILDIKCDPYTPSYNLILSGHHMKNGTMFGGLPQYKSQKYWQKHPFVEFDSLMYRKKYVIFAAFYSADYDEDEEGFRYNAVIDYKMDCDQWLSEIKENQLYDTGIEVEFGDEFVTLTTCDRSRHRNGRFVVVCRKIREGETFE